MRGALVNFLKVKAPTRKKKRIYQDILKKKKGKVALEKTTHESISIGLAMDVIGIHRCSILLLLLTSANLLLSHGSSAGILLSPPLSLYVYFSLYNLQCSL